MGLVPSTGARPLVEKWLFDEVNKNRAEKRGSRDGDNLNSRPLAMRKYFLRGRVFHDCERRMIGDQKGKGAIYHLCWPGKNNRDAPGLHPGPPPSIRVREDELLEAICRFYADRLFGTRRQAILLADLAGLDDSGERERAAQRTRHEKALATITRQQESILRQAREGDPDDPFTQGLRQS